MIRVTVFIHHLYLTYKIQEVFVLGYSKKFFSEIVKGHKDYKHYHSWS